MLLYSILTTIYTRYDTYHTMICLRVKQISIQILIARYKFKTFYDSLNF